MPVRKGKVVNAEWAGLPPGRLTLSTALRLPLSDSEKVKTAGDSMEMELHVPVSRFFPRNNTCPHVFSSL